MNNIERYKQYRQTQVETAKRVKHIPALCVVQGSECNCWYGRKEARRGYICSQPLV